MKIFLVIICNLFFAVNTYAQIDLEFDDMSIDYNSESLDFSEDSSQSSGIISNIKGILGKKEDTKKNKTSVDELKAKADAGDIEALLDLGYMYLYGENGVTIDYKQSLHYYELAANTGNAVALNNLGSLYFNGIGTDVNYGMAVKFFEKAAENGSVDAAVNLAIIYLASDNNSSKTDRLQKVFSMLEKSQANSIVKYLIGYSYYVGFWYEKDYAKAFSLIKDVADNDEYDEAQFILANFYINGFATPKNYNKAVYYLEKAVSQGNASAMLQLGDILSEGLIYTKNIEKAHIMYNLSSVLGEKEASKKRDDLEKIIKIDNLLMAQSEADNFVENPSQKTSFIRKTYGKSLKTYIDRNIK